MVVVGTCSTVENSGMLEIVAICAVCGTCNDVIRNEIIMNKNNTKTNINNNTYELPTLKTKREHKFVYLHLPIYGV